MSNPLFDALAASASARADSASWLSGYADLLDRLADTAGADRRTVLAALQSLPEVPQDAAGAAPFAGLLNAHLTLQAQAAALEAVETVAREQARDGRRCQEMIGGLLLGQPARPQAAGMADLVAQMSDQGGWVLDAHRTVSAQEDGTVQVTDHLGGTVSVHPAQPADEPAAVAANEAVADPVAPALMKEEEPVEPTAREKVLAKRKLAVCEPVGGNGRQKRYIVRLPGKNGGTTLGTACTSEEAAWESAALIVGKKK